MRTAILPAQITTVEDKIAGNLSLSQVILLVIPIVFSGFIYFVAPPFNKLSIYKIAISIIISSVFLMASYRYNGKIMLQHIVDKGRYFLRPHIYVYKRGESVVAEEPNPASTKKKQSAKKQPKPKASSFNLSEFLKLRSSLPEQNLKMSFKFTKKGMMNVSVTEE